MAESSVQLKFIAFPRGSTVDTLTPEQRRVLDIHAELFSPTKTGLDSSDPYATTILNGLLEDPSDMDCYAIKDPETGEIVGMTSVDDSSAPEMMEIDTLVIDHEKRDRNYGARAVALIELLAQDRGIARVSLTPANAAAEHFWKRNGYQQTRPDVPGRLDKQLS